jgi:hypothetical protein
MKAVNKEFTVLNGDGQTASAVGYSQAMQKAVNSLDKNNEAYVLIRVTKEKSDDEETQSKIQPE